MSDWEEMTLVQLRTKAKELGMKNINKMRKSELVEIIITPLLLSQKK